MFGGWGVRSKDQTGVLVGIVTHISSLGAKPRVAVHVFGLEVAGHHPGCTQPNQAVTFAPMSGMEGESKPARTITSLPARITSMAVASKLVRPGECTEGLYLGGIGWLCRNHCRYVCAVAYIIGNSGGLTIVEKCLT